MQPAGRQIFRFGAFEVDLQSGELRRSGLKVKIQEQPLQVLSALLERPDEIVTRDELRKRLWPADTFVDFEHSLNAAVKKLRDALGDAANSPRFVETVPLRGYRFVAPVEPPGLEAPDRPAPARLRWRWWTAAAVGAGAIAASMIASGMAPMTAPRLVGSTQLTVTGRAMAPYSGQEVFPGLVTDGARVYFSELSLGRLGLAHVSAAGGEVLPIPVSFKGQAQILHLSPDGSQLLVRNWVAGETEDPLWLVPTAGGGARRLGDVLGHAGAWTPDGGRLIYAHGQDLYLAKADGSEARKLVTTPGRAFWLRWSPDGKRLRFTVVDIGTHSRSLWEVSANGTELRRLLPRRFEQEDECCGEWTPDGRYFVFRTLHDNRADIWLIREGAGLFGRANRDPVRLTTGPLHFSAAVPSRDGKRLFVVGAEPRRESLRYDLRSREFIPYQQGFPGYDVAYSRDGQWVVHREMRAKEQILWRSRVDGSERLQLTHPPLAPMIVRWSPDGKRIAFMGKAPGRPWKIYVVSTEGGSPQQLLQGDRNEADPNWSPDGRSLMFGHPPDYMAEPGLPKAIYVIDLRTRQVSTLPGSEGLFSPRWSPDGHHVVAMPLNQTKLMIFDFTTRKWTELARHSPENPAWSRDGRLVYFQAFAEEGAPIYRVRMSDRKLERVVGLRELNRPNVMDCGFSGLALDGSPLLSCALSRSNIYALEWEAR